MYNLDKTYNKDYYGKRMDWKESQYKILAETFMGAFNPKSVVDVGCGNGILLKHIPESINALGVEGSKNGKDSNVSNREIIMKDLRNPFPECFRHDGLVVSIEVAEHLEPEYAEVFVQNLCKAGKDIIITAAQPHETSVYHFNCQPKQYWVGLFSKFGYRHNTEKETEIVNILKEKLDKERAYLYNNLMVFKNE